MYIFCVENTEQCTFLKLSGCAHQQQCHEIWLILGKIERDYKRYVFSHVCYNVQPFETNYV